MVNNTLYTWTTGGGVSNYINTPSWQQTAYTAYLNSKALIPPKWTFNVTGRAYPDIAATGSRILIWNGGQVGISAGTSASTPIVAAVLSLLNDYLLGQGKAPLGLASPLLYEIFAANPKAFNAVKAGANPSTEGSVCEYGYGVQHGGGFSPVTGLGTPNYAAFLAYIKANLK